MNYNELQVIGKNTAPLLFALIVTGAIVAGTQTVARNNASILQDTHEAALVLSPKSKQVKRSSKIASIKEIPSVFAKDDIEKRHQIIAMDTLSSMPSKCQSQLKTFSVRYDNPRDRGLAGSSTMILTGNVPDSEFRALFIHEFGHITDLGCLRGTNGTKTEFYDGKEPILSDDLSLKFYRLSWKSATEKKSDAQASEFISGYAQSDPFEDFAETFAAYALEQSAFEELSQTNDNLRKKYEFMRDEVFKNEQPPTKSLYTFKTNERPWDITKLQFAWGN